MDDHSVTSKGQVTIPKKVRQQLGIRAGSKVRFRVVGDHAEIALATPAAPAHRSGAGMLRHQAPAVPADFDVASLLARKRSR